MNLIKFSHRPWNLVIYLIALNFLSCTPKTGSISNVRPSDKTQLQYISQSNQGEPISVTIKKFNDFSYRYLSSVVTDHEENIVVSPVSLEFVLAMLANGADEHGCEEILNYLNLGSLQDINNLNLSLINRSKEVERDSSFLLSNSIWLDKGVKLKHDYLVQVQNMYNASIHTLNRNPQVSRKDINLWACEKTKGIIPEFLKQPLSKYTKLALYNACYFYGQWIDRFYDESTNDAVFHTPLKDVMIPTMKNTIDYQDYYYTEKYEAVRLSIRKGRTMKIILPYKEYSISRVLKSLPEEEKIEKNCRITISLPKFKMRYRVEGLKEMLEKYGVKSVFDSDKGLCNLTNMAADFGNLGLSQETVIEVEEGGVAGAAVTGVDFAYESGIENKPNKIINFEVNRPFIFTVEDNNTGAVLFTGIVYNSALSEH